MRLKWFGVLFLCFTIFGLSLSVSLNAKALDFVVQVEPTGNTYTVGSDLRCTIDNNYNISTVIANTHGECNIPQGSSSSLTVYIRNIYLNRSIEVTEGNYYTFFLGYETSEGFGNVAWNLNTNNNDWSILEFKQVTQDEMINFCTRWRSSNQTNLDYYCGTTNTGWLSNYYSVTLKAKKSGNLTPILGNMSGIPRSFMITTLGQISMSTIYESKPSPMAEMNEKDNQDRNDLEQQSGDIDSEAQDTSSDLSNASSNIFTQASNILGAFNTPSTDCIISVTTGSQGSLKLNNMNICNMPSEMRSMTQTILTIVVAIAVLLIGWNVVRTTLEVYNEILGG